MKDKLVIVPNEKKLDCNIFEKENQLSIVDNINEFCKENKLRSSFRKADKNKAPDTIAKKGHMLIKTQSTNIIWIYLPQVVSNNQLKWLQDNEKELKKYNTVGVFNYNEDNKPENLMSIIELLKIANEKNKKFKGSESNAR